MKSPFVTAILGLSLSFCPEMNMNCRILAGSLDTTLPAESVSIDDPAPVTSADRVVWPHDGSDLKPDPNALWGSLDNGMRYVILPHTQSPGRASLRLRIDAGSLNERDDQRGVAHFLEHMAFNGTRNLPGNQMVAFFQRMGMSFGAHTNATTGFTETIFKLEVPNTDRIAMGEALTWFRDILDGLTINEQEVERERGVILSEATAGNSGQFRQTVDSLSFLLPGTQISQRLPIGDLNVIRNMTAEQLRDFHQFWYSPQQALLVVVGDVEPRDLQDLLVSKFGDIAPGTTAQKPVIGSISSGQGLKSRLYLDPEIGTSTITIAVERPFVPPADTVAYQKQQLITLFANAMLNERFKSLVEKPGSPVLSASANRSEAFGMLDEWSLAAQIDPAGWNDAVHVMEQELRRATEYGFSAEAFQNIESRVINYINSSAEAADSRATSELADTVVSELGKNHVVTHPSQDAELCRMLLTEITADDCSRSLREICETDDVSIFVSGTSREAFGFGEQDDCEVLIQQAWKSSHGRTVEPLAATARAEFAYTDFGNSGEIVECKEVSDLQTVQLTFKNNVRVSMKPTDFEKNRVRVVVRFGSGLLEADKSIPGLPEATEAVFIAGGLGAHDFAELNRLLADKQWSAEFTVAEDAFLFRGQSTTADLETVLQVITAFISDPGYHPTALEQLHTRLDDLYGFLEHSSDGMLQRTLQSAIHDGDPRFGFPAREQLAAVTMNDISTWLEQPLKHGYMEVAVAGDFDADKVKDLLAATLGTLPERDATRSDYTEARKVQIGAEGGSKTWKFTSQSPAASTTILWPTVDATDTAIARRMTVLSLILKDRIRLKVREELGATYSPEVVSSNSDVFPEYGFIAAQLTAEPEDVARISSMVTEIADGLAQGQISDDEFKRAMTPHLNNLKQEMRGNIYWTGVLCRCQEQSDWLEAARSRIADNKAITREELQSLARQYLGKDRSLIYNLIPEPAETSR